MRIRALSELAIYEAEPGTESVRLKDILPLFIDKASDMIYVTEDGKLAGIICLEDMTYDDTDSLIRIVRNCYRLDGFDDVRAREVFRTRRQVQKIPVTDAEGRMLGDYSRWSDVDGGNAEWILSQKIWGALKKYIKDEHPAGLFLLEAAPSRRGILGIFTDFLDEKKVSYKRISRIDLRDQEIGDGSLVICADMNEERGSAFLYEAYHGDHGAAFMSILSLYKSLDAYDKYIKTVHFSASSEGEGAGKALKELQEKGVHVVCLYDNVYNVTQYIKGIIRKNTANRHIYPLKTGEFWPVDTPMGEQFFGELLEDEDYRSGGAQEQMLEGHRMHGTGEYRSRYYNVSGGRRRTCGQPEEYSGEVYMFGVCTIMGAYHEDQFTIASRLQARLNEKGIPYRVVNCGSYDNVFEKMQAETFHEGDVVILWTGEDAYEGMDSIDIRKVYEDNEVPAEWCLNEFGHVNHKVTALIADALFGIVEGAISGKNIETAERPEVRFVADGYKEILGGFVEKAYLKRYFDIKAMSGLHTGCILAEPDISPEKFASTIHEAVSEVDYMIVFIPERVLYSEYSYDEYFLALSSMFAEDPHVTVASGDQFVPYAAYFHSYYTYHPGEVSINVRNAETDCRIFADCIADPLGISIRYAVEADTARSRDYNSVMEKVLPSLGIEFRRLEVRE